MNDSGGLTTYIAAANLTRGPVSLPCQPPNAQFLFSSEWETYGGCRTQSDPGPHDGILLPNEFAVWTSADL